ncbi:MAG: hypothetical protein K2X03_01365 [Bryobacteraceae bacterium]|nr:hypothetical protein [Bryobacteraceae bacterium]
MSSKKRIEANRRNALGSTGPRTPEGKARSAQNATTHGLSSLNRNPLAAACFLQMEDKDQYLGMLNQYLATYSPQGQHELDLLTEAVFAKFRQQRLWAAEAAQLEVAIAKDEKEFRKTLPNADPRAHLANGIAKSEQILKLYLRYDAQLNRLYRNCLKDLRDLQAQRIAQPAEPEPTPIEPKSETEITPNEPKPQPTPEEVAAEANRRAFQRRININLGRPADWEPPTP